MSSISLMERAERIDRVREEIRRRRKEHPKLYSWSNLEEDISSAAGFPVSRTAIRQFVGGGRPGRDELWRAYDAWGVREGVLDPLPPADEEALKAESVELGKRVRRLREQLGWNQSRLGEEVGVTQSTISRLEDGISKNPDPHLVESVLRVVEARAPYGSEGNPASSDELWRQIDMINALEAPDSEKSIKVDAIAAALRARAHEKEAAAAQERARAMAIEAELARDRLEGARGAPSIPTEAFEPASGTGGKKREAG